MGYTHYWQKTKETSDEDWGKFTEFVKELIETVNGTEIENSAAGGRAVVIIKDGCGEDVPVINDAAVSFNGDSSQDLDHEGFYIAKDGTGGFNFCKTARKPYDPVVVACLVEAKRLGIIDEWSSDGEEEDHQSGIDLHRSVLGRFNFTFGKQVKQTLDVD